jgi:hypothetical protein
VQVIGIVVGVAAQGAAGEAVLHVIPEAS